MLPVARTLSLWVFMLLLSSTLSRPFAQGQAAQAPAGAIRGTVYDADFDAPLSGVRVSVVEALLTATTESNGAFLIRGVPPGTYTLSFAKAGFEREILTDVAVSGIELTDVGTVKLGSEVVDMPEMVVTATEFLAGSEVEALEIRATALSLQDTVSNELLSKAGVGDVAGALQLVTGASVSEGKYATVRGLSDRYTGTTLNGIRVPSADPRKRAVQVDFFPTGTVEKVTVTKSFTPDLQGEFTGGGVDIQTKSVPDSRQTSFSFSWGYNSEATGNSRFLTYDGGGLDWAGFDVHGDRDLPSFAEIAPNEAPPPPAQFDVILRPPTNPTNIAINEANAAKMKFYSDLTRSFSGGMGVRTERAGWDGGFTFQSGNRYDVGGGTIGVSGALTYSHKFDSYEGVPNKTAGVSVPLTDDSTLGTIYDRTDAKSSEEIVIGGLFNLVYRPGDRNEYSFKAIVNQSAEDTARFQYGNAPNGPRQNQVLRYTERTLASGQFHGSHQLPGLHLGSVETPGEVKWRAAYNYTRQNEPDTRFFKNYIEYSTGNAARPNNETAQGVTRRIFRDIEEHNVQYGADVTVPLAQWSGLEAKIKTGFLVDTTTRDLSQRSFAYDYLRSFNAPGEQDDLNNEYQSFEPDRDCALSSLPCSEDPRWPFGLWTDVFTAPERLGLSPTEVSPNQIVWYLLPLGTDVPYDGDQDIDAAYAMLDLPLSPKVKVMAGARFETTDISITPNPPDGTSNAIEVVVSPTGRLSRRVTDPPAAQSATKITERDWLPAVSLTWEPVPRMNVRGSWSHTIARPTFRELAPTLDVEFLDGDIFVGKYDLKMSRITNYDLRWEWFRRPGEVLAASVFYKDITDPIELISFGIASARYIQPDNFPHGSVEGYELEARTSLDVLWAPLRGFSVGANYAHIDSTVDVPVVEYEELQENYNMGEEERRLQGQPTYVANFNLTFDSERLGTSAAVFVNRVGQTVLTGAAKGGDNATPTLYRDSNGTVDLTLRQKLPVFGKRFSLGFKAENVLRSTERKVYRAPNGIELIGFDRELPHKLSLSAKMEW